MSFTTDLAAGIAVHLDAAGVGVWRPNGGYADTDTAIVMKAMPQQPHRCIALTAYANLDDPLLPLGQVAVQFRCRGTDPRHPDDDADAIFDLLHATNHLLLGGLRVVQMFRQSSAQLGQDSTGRWERADNYYATVQQPTSHRPQA